MRKYITKRQILHPSEVDVNNEVKSTVDSFLYESINIFFNYLISPLNLLCNKFEEVFVFLYSMITEFFPIFFCFSMCIERRNYSRIRQSMRVL